jgi:prevent-host-death family protein
MRTVNIGNLKARLSAYIRSVRDGEEVLVCDRNTPVARIIPCHLSEESKQEQRLVARGVLAPPRRRRAESAEWPQPPGDISDDVIAEVWRRERESR